LDSIESNTIIIAACIPTIIPLIERMFRRRKDPIELPSLDLRDRPGWNTVVYRNTSHRQSSDLASNSIFRTDEVIIQVDDAAHTSH
jgi:hypothetical protein